MCTACGVTSSAPLDDAYYWPDKVESGESNVESREKFEIISQQDTTITVRIKR